jgi:hypothetical protein
MNDITIDEFGQHGADHGTESLMTSYMKINDGEDIKPEIQCTI